jgi:spore coat polysaccharide biosynthesis protein SpsF
MKIGAIILSRFSSARLPGKALKKINGKEVLKIIVERLEKVLPRNDIIIATSIEHSDNPIVDFALKENINYYRGSLNNVAERFLNSAELYGFDYAIRINGDNIFVDIKLLKHLISIAMTNKFDFISNVKNRTYPKGMSIEIVRKSYYSTLIPKISNKREYKEHVTSYLYENEDINFHFVYNESNKDAQGLQLALDTEIDFIRSTKIISKFSDDHWNYNLKENIKYLERN